jgi:xanthine dehydrogenase molybdenum-binding subunit
MLERAADELGLAPEELDIDNGRIYVKADPEGAIKIRDLMAKTASGMGPIVGRGTVRCPHWPQKAYTFGAHFAIVEVDIETGEIKVLKYVAVHDVGRALNHVIVEGQIQGGVIMGISQTLNEELIFDQEGRPVNLSPVDYKIFTSSDCPEIKPIILELKDPLGPYGAMGVGESPTVGVPGCLANAIYNAIGIRFKEIPITAEKVLKALKES